MKPFVRNMPIKRPTGDPWDMNLESIEVFIYGWTEYDYRTGSESWRFSTYKVTREYFANRLKFGKLPPYRLEEETMERVAAEQVVGGKFRKEIHA